MRWFIRSRWALSGVLLCAGVGLLGWSWFARSDGWLSGALVNGGTTLVLFAPLLLVGRYIEKRLDEVQASQAQIEQQQEAAVASIATLAEEVSQTQTELRRTRERLSEAVASRLASAREKDRQTFIDVEETPSHEALFTALVRAAELNLIASSGCRVPVGNTRLYLRFDRPADNSFTHEPDPADDLDIRLEGIDGQQAGQLWWSREQTAEEFLVELSEELVRVGEYPGDSSFKAGSVLGDLRELLELAYDSATGGAAAPLRGVIQFCRPQWVITEVGLVSVGKPAGYSISFSRIREPHWSSHMTGKPWLNRDSFDEAFEIAVAMDEAASRAAAQRADRWDEPPF